MMLPRCLTSGQQAQRPSGWWRIAYVIFVAELACATSASNATCEASPSQRVDCFGGEAEWQQKGCCWRPVEPNPHNYPWCFHKGSPSPGPEHQTVGSTFVHLFEWSWPDVAQECEQWLGPKGFRGVQVSPPNDHIAGDAWWTRYQPVTYKLVSRSGDEAAFAEMVRRCKAAGVDIYVDAVINHIAAGSGTSIAGSSYGNRATPTYSQQDMHHDAGDVSKNCAISNYADKNNVQYCDLVGLPDLCTGCENVQMAIAGYLNNLASLGVAGFRIDAAKHQDAGELAQLLAKVNGSMWRFGEVISGANEAVTPNMYFSIMDVTEFDYARKVVPNFLEDGKLQYLQSFGESWGLMPSDKAVVFLDNHDTQRGEAKLTHTNPGLYQLANIFMLAHPYGYPKVMSSYFFASHDQGPPREAVHGERGVACGNGRPWVCEHRWPAIANMAAWRRAAGAADVTGFQAHGPDTVAFCRGRAACVALNRGAGAWSASLRLPAEPGTYCDVIRSDDPATCPRITVASDGSVRLEVPALGAVAFHIGRKAAETTISV